MPPPRPTISLEDALARAHRLGADGRRCMLGITGPPGAGKSTLAARIADAVGARACVIGMDGFHLAQRELERLGRARRKGAPDTFDVDGYVALLQRIRAQVDETVYAPEFRRELEEPVAGAVPVPPDATLVVTEGNYLLLPGPAWGTVRELLDEIWYVSTEQETRVRWLIDRHVLHGRTPTEARDWVRRSDERNAELVEETRAGADLIVRNAGG